MAQKGFRLIADITGYEQHRSGLQTRQKLSGKSIVVSLTRRQPKRQAIFVHARMNLAGQAAP